jgi:hypothetical protein
MNLMIRFIIFLIALLMLAACSPQDIERLTPIKITYVEPIQLTEHPIAKLDSIKGTKQEVFQAEIAIQKLNALFASTCFEAQVLTRQFTETNDMNTQEIYNAFRSGIIHVNLIFYTGSWIENHIMGTVGYIRENIPDTVFQNRVFVKDSNEIGRNLIHEIAHLVKFNHYGLHSTSVPYQMNEIWDYCTTGHNP